MKAVIQRVSHSSVTVDGKMISSISKGLMILLGVGYEDTIDDISWLVRKISQMRIFPDENDVMNLSVRRRDPRCKSVHSYGFLQKGEQAVLYRCSCTGYRSPVV